MEKSIELYRKEDQMLNDAIDKIVVGIHIYRQKLGYKTFLFSGCGSESGTTTLTLDLAIALSMAGWKTLLVDCDFRKSGSYQKNEDSSRLGLSDYLANVVEKKEVIYHTNYELLDLIPSGQNVTSPVRLLCSQNMEELITEVKEEYDYVIFDFPSINIVPDAQAVLNYVDGIVLVTALNQTTKRQLSDARRKVMQYSEKYCGMLVNKVDITQYRQHMRDYDYFRKKKIEKKPTLYFRKKNLKKDMCKK